MPYRSTTGCAMFGRRSAPIANAMAMSCAQLGIIASVWLALVSPVAAQSGVEQSPVRIVAAFPRTPLPAAQLARTPIIPVNAPMPGAQCVARGTGAIACRQAGSGAHVYALPVTPDMAGQTVDIAALTPGVSVFPPLQRIASGQTSLRVEISGAKPGNHVRLLRKVISPNTTAGADGELCCNEEVDVAIPDVQTCSGSIALLSPSRLPKASPPVAPKPIVSIEKQCSSCAAGAPCTCRVTLRNVGIDAVPATIGFKESATRAGGTPVEFTSFRPDGGDWRCTRSGGSLSCELPPGALAALASRSVDVTMAPGSGGGAAGQDARMRNCATLSGDGVTLANARQREACVDAGSDLVVRKSGGQQCRFGEQCVFEITIANQSRGTYDGRLVISDLLSLDGRGERVRLLSIDPPLGCATQPTTLPFECTAQLRLMGGESRTHRITVRLDEPGDRSAAGGKNSSGRNCVTIADASATAAFGTSLTAETRRILASARSGGPPVPSSSSIACVEFATVTQCPGDLVRRGTQCVCGDGQERSEDDRCRPTCRQGERRQGDRCVEIERPVTSAPSRSPPLPVLPPPRPQVPEQCPGDLVRLSNDGGSYCGCRPPHERRGTSCVAPVVVVPPRDCIGDLVWIVRDGQRSCGCPAGYLQQGSRCTRPQAPPINCPGQLQPYGPLGSQTCRCPQGLVQNGALCTKPQAPPETKECNGRQIPIRQYCPPPPKQTKPCNGREIPVGQYCPPPPQQTKRCNGREIPVSQNCPAPPPPVKPPPPPPAKPPPPPKCTPVKTCVRYGPVPPSKPGSGGFGNVAPCIQYEMRCPSAGPR